MCASTCDVLCLTRFAGVRYASMGYDTYVATIRNGHIGLDSFPYGGCNSVFVRLPGVCRNVALLARR